MPTHSRQLHAFLPKYSTFARNNNAQGGFVAPMPSRPGYKRPCYHKSVLWQYHAHSCTLSAQTSECVRYQVVKDGPGLDIAIGALIHTYRALMTANGSWQQR
ncbi:hypothetical protein V2G26_009665 [Clonostachys chloroleuca]